MKSKILIKNTLKNSLLFVLAIYLVTSCSKEEIQAPTAVLSGDAIILEGDSTSLSVNFKGVAPFGFSYYWIGKNETKHVGYIYDVTNTNHTFKLAPDTTTTIIAEYTSTKYQEPVEASGQANITVKPVKYIYDQTVPANNSAYIYTLEGFKTGNELDVRNQGLQWDKIAYIEFDLSSINTVEENNKYTFRFWLTRSHAQGASAGPGYFEVKAIAGVIDPSWTWETQPEGAEMELISLEPFNATTTSQQIKFETDVTGFIRNAIENKSNKIYFRITETQNKGLYYLGSHTYPTEDKRPGIDIALRRADD